MDIQKQIDQYITDQPPSKRADLQALHQMILRLHPESKLWFLDGRNSDGKIVSNPNIGYGFYTIRYADGKTKDFYQVGLSANTSGISVYIMGLPDKEYLAKTYGNEIGKAVVTGYCIKFKTLKDIDVDVLQKAVQYGFEAER